MFNYDAFFKTANRYGTKYRGRVSRRRVDLSARAHVAPDRPVSFAVASPINATGMHPFQVEGSATLRAEPRWLLADEMGLGKTVQVCRALPRGARVVVVCPQIARRVWRDELARWRPDLRVSLSALDRAPEVGEVLVVSIDGLPDPEGGTILPHAKLRAVQLVVDEAHYVKNPRAERTRRTRMLARRCGGVWLLTGTPLDAEPIDLWNVLDVADLARRAFQPARRRDGRSPWREFMRVFKGKKIRWETKTGRKMWRYVFGTPLPEARSMLQRVMTRRLQRDVLDLPRVQRRVIPVEIDEEIAQMLDHAGAEWIASAGEDELPPLELWSPVRAALAEALIPAMLAEVERWESSTAEPMLVFAAHTAPIETLRSREGWDVIMGSTSPEDRARIVARFQRGELRGLGLTIGVAGVSVTLTAASYALFVNRDFRPGQNNQAEGRILRIGQRAKRLTIAVMVADHPVDRRVMQTLERRERVIGSVLG